MATPSPGLRKALIAGGIAVALTGAGGAAVWAGTQPSPSSSDSSSATAIPGPSPSETKPHGAQAIHGEHVVKDPDGTFRTILTQAGTIDSVSGTEITVKSEDGFTQRYAINGDTKISKVPQDISKNGRGKPSLPSIAATDLKAGDKVHVAGTKSGNTVTAQRIIAGELPVMMGGHGPRGHGPKQSTSPGN